MVCYSSTMRVEEELARIKMDNRWGPYSRRRRWNKVCHRTAVIPHVSPECKLLPRWFNIRQRRRNDLREIWSLDIQTKIFRPFCSFKAKYLTISILSYQRAREISMNPQQTAVGKGLCRRYHRDNTTQWTPCRLRCRYMRLCFR